MQDQNDDIVDRRSLMAGLGIAAAAGLVATATTAQAQQGSRRTPFQPARHDIDAWFDQIPGTHRIFIDSGSANGGAEAVGYAGNLFLATSAAYAGQNADPAIVVCFRHFSTPFGYNDAMWAKYGEIFNMLMTYPDPATGAAPKINLLNSSAHKTLGNRGVLIDDMAAKGVQFAICNMATQFISDFIAQQTGGKADEIHAEIMKNNIKNSRFVSAGVVALTRSQEYGYSVLISG